LKWLRFYKTELQAEGSAPYPGIAMRQQQKETELPGCQYAVVEEQSQAACKLKVNTTPHETGHMTMHTARRLSKYMVHRPSVEHKVITLRLLRGCLQPAIRKAEDTDRQYLR
jgi:hypothetical protein